MGDGEAEEGVEEDGEEQSQDGVDFSEMVPSMGGVEGPRYGMRPMEKGVRRGRIEEEVVTRLK